MDRFIVCILSVLLTLTGLQPAWAGPEPRANSFLAKVAVGKSQSQLRGRITIPQASGNLVVEYNPLLSPRTTLKARQSASNFHYLAVNSSANITLAEVHQVLEREFRVELVEVSPVRYPIYTPNDPLINQQYYLDLLNAYQAWDIQRSSSEVVIAIVDSGVDLDHPDLAENIHYNLADPINGIDDDGDGYVDNYVGWDFVGDDYTQIEEDNNPDVAGSNLGHGTAVAGCAAAVSDNGLGIASLSFNARIMPLKHSAENDTRSNGSGFVLRSIEGVVYAAEHGADIINASYGGPVFSQIEQEIFGIIAESYGVLVVAAAGNSNSEEPLYPADYDYVLSVAATDGSDRRSNFSNFGYQVDVSAPGSAILTTTVNGNYSTVSGTSFSAPIVAGLAALVKSYYPDFTGPQVGELIRVTSDPSFKDNLSPEFKEKMGRGRVDALAALTQTSPSVRFDKVVVEAQSGGSSPRAGEEAYISGLFTNFLWPTSGLSVTLESLNPMVRVIQPSFTIGTLNELETVSNQQSPFVVEVDEDILSDQEVVLRLRYQAADYTDTQYIKVLVNPSFFNLHTDSVATTITANGRIGRAGPSGSQGVGFAYSGINLLYEMGLMVAISPNELLNSVRGVSGLDNDFNSTVPIRRVFSGPVADTEVFGQFDDAGTSLPGDLDILVDYRAYAWTDPQLANVIFLEYELTNQAVTELEGLYAGLYADWDISLGGATDTASWNDTYSLGYIYTLDETGWAAGIQVLSGTPNYYAINNDPEIDDSSFGVYDGFTDEEKWLSLSQGIAKKTAGTSQGADVSHTVASGPYAIAAEDSQKVFFALHAAANVEELVRSAASAQAWFRANFEDPTGLPQLLDNQYRLYPNPGKGVWTLRLDDALSANNVSLSLTDLQGRNYPLSFRPNSDNTLTISSDRLMPGIYLLHLISDGKQAYCKLMVH